MSQLSVFIVCFPPFQAGLWAQTEPVLLTLFFLAVFNAIWLAIGVSKAWLTWQRGDARLFLCLTLWVGWQCVSTAFATSPWRSWFGAENGEGAGWYLAVLLSFMLANPLWQSTKYRTWILRWALLLVGVLCLFHVCNPDKGDAWSPYAWPKYLAFMQGWIFVSIMTIWDAKNKMAYVGLAVFSFAVLYVSGNDSARILFPPAILVTGIALCKPTWFLQYVKIWRCLAMVACVLPLGWVVISQYPALFPNKNTGMGARAVLNQISVATMKNEPVRWLVGDGWGRYSDDAFKYALVEGEYHFLDGKPALSRNNGNSFHSHNQPMEALLSLGLPGFFLWFAFPLLALGVMPSTLFWCCAPMLCAVTILGFLWFPVPQLLAFAAIFQVALCSACAVPERKTINPISPYFLLLVIVAVVAMLWSTCEQWQTIHYGQELKTALHEKAYSSYNPQMMAQDAERGGDRLRVIANDYALWLMAHPQEQASDNARGWYTNLMYAADIMAQSPRIGARAASLELWLQNMLMLGITDPQFAGLKRESLPFYPALAMRLAVQAPAREDEAAFYLSTMAVQFKDKPAAQIDILGRLLALNPTHRSALWLTGQLLVKTPEQKTQGESMLRYAARLGVGKVYPVSDKELAPYLTEGN